MPIGLSLGNCLRGEGRGKTTRTQKREGKQRNINLKCQIVRILMDTKRVTTNCTRIASVGTVEPKRLQPSLVWICSDIFREPMLLGLTSPVERKETFPDLVTRRIESFLQQQFLSNIQIVTLFEAKGSPTDITKLLIARLIGITVGEDVVRL